MSLARLPVLVLAIAPQKNCIYQFRIDVTTSTERSKNRDKKNKWYHWVLVAGVLCVLVAPSLAYSAGRVLTHGDDPKSSPSYQSCQQEDQFNFDEFTKNKRFNLNTLCTTPYPPPPDAPDTPAWADILVAPQNFVACKGATIALCYYSGPTTLVNDDATATPCTLRGDEDIADCTCYEIPASGHWYFVDINAILNLDVYLDTVDTCGMDGSECLPSGRTEAPVCEAIRKGKLIPGADLISTFSLALEGEIPIATDNNSCTEEDPLILYAGCMTAPCKSTNVIDPYTGYPLVQCACPTFTGPFQVGREITNVEPCDLPDEDGTVWSAAYTTFDPPTFPECIPDAPGENGCPLLPEDFEEGDVPVPPDVSCQKVCSEYKQSNQNGIQVGFTCDATLCTDPSNRALVADACMGLGKHSTSEILKLEAEVGFSCAASQICGCEPNKKTNEEISRLNEIQRAEPGIDPQCDVNGTLCGTEPR